MLYPLHPALPAWLRSRRLLPEQPARAARRRYQRGSEICERFAQSLHHLTAIEERELFDFGSRGEAPPVLLVLDRRDDPVTPLLSQWTYQVGGRAGLAAAWERARWQCACIASMVHCCAALVHLTGNTMCLRAWPAGHGARAHRHQHQPGGPAARARRQARVCRGSAERAPGKAGAVPAGAASSPQPRCHVVAWAMDAVRGSQAAARTSRHLCSCAGPPTLPSPEQDPFFRANMYANFGDLGMAVKGLVDSASRWAWL